MIRYLLDTNIISELHKPRPHGAVVAWFNALLDDQVHLSAITLLELQDGIERMRKHDLARAQALESWVDDLERSSIVVPMDVQCFREAARMMMRKEMTEKQDWLLYDAMIAAIARLHNFTIATRNEKDFRLLGVAIFNPFKP